jgi:hypothetical protein
MCQRSIFLFEFWPYDRKLTEFDRKSTELIDFISAYAAVFY